MTLDLLCRCSHRASEHVHGDDGKSCKRSCNCREFRLDPRSRLRDESEDAATTEGAA